jgi:hypothetical protein
MDQIGIVVAVFALMCVAVVLAVVPTRLPWAQRVRWTVFSQATNYGGFVPMLCRPNDLREVALLSVDVHDEQLTMSILENGHPTHHTLTVVGSAPTTEVTAMLHEWRALRTPMVFFHDGAGGVSLHGPIASVTGLKLSSSRAGQRV